MRKFIFILFCLSFLSGCDALSEDHELTHDLLPSKELDAPIDSLPEHTLDAFVSIEDKRFYDHGALDFIGLARAVWNGVKDGDFAEGGSTITQQLVKNAFLTHERTAERKAKEIYISFKIEKKYSKAEILEYYLNLVYFGESAYGIKEASSTYFGKEPSELTIEESALLAGLLQAPSAYNPYHNPEMALERRNMVLHAMYENGKISKKEYEQSILKPVTLK